MAAVEQAKATIQHNENYRPDPTAVEAPLAPGAPKATKKDESPAELAQTFLDSFQKAIRAEDVEGIAKLFREDGWWRDILTIDSGDFNAFKSNEIVRLVLCKKQFVTSALTFGLRQVASLKKFGVPKLENMKVIKVGSSLSLLALVDLADASCSLSTPSLSPSTPRRPGFKLTSHSKPISFEEKASSVCESHLLEPTTGAHTLSSRLFGKSRVTRTFRTIADLSEQSTDRRPVA